MKEVKTIEQQVAELTEEQKDKILKVGFWGLIAYCIIFIPIIIFLLLGVFTMATDPLMFTDKAYKGFLLICAFTIILSITMVVVIKLICPYYSDKKYRYIKKSKKK